MNIKAKDIIAAIERKAPLDLAYDWDNPGLLCGCAEKEVSKVLLTLDANVVTAEEAVKKGADMIVSHHPVFFSPLKRIDTSTAEGRMIEILIKNDITLYAAHTNLDTAPEGINAALADMFEFWNTDIIERHTPRMDAGLGRIGDLPESITLAELAEKVKRVLHTPFVRVSGDPKRVIHRAAVGSGSCSELIPEARRLGADVMITGDMKYHNAIDGVLDGICIIDAGHYPTETVAMDLFEDWLSETGVETVKSEWKDIFEAI